MTLSTSVHHSRSLITLALLHLARPSLIYMIFQPSLACMSQAIARPPRSLLCRPRPCRWALGRLGSDRLGPQATRLSLSQQAALPLFSVPRPPRTTPVPVPVCVLTCFAPSSCPSFRTTPSTAANTAPPSSNDVKSVLCHAKTAASPCSTAGT